MLVRDPANLYERHGRQLLVTGVQFDGQQALFALGAAIACDQSPLARAAAEVCARYLVGAGLGRILAPTAIARDLPAIDPELQVATNPADLCEPCLHLHLRGRPFGAEAELVWLDGGATRQSLLLWHSSGGLADAVALGGAVAQLVLDDVLGLNPLPAVVRFDLDDPQQPLRQQEQPTDPLAAVSAEVWQPVEAACAAAYPREAAGLLVQNSDHSVHCVLGEQGQAEAFVVAPEHFAQANPHLLAVWHSHPDGSTELSAVDQAWARAGNNPAPTQVILATTGPQVTARQVHVWSALAGRYVSVNR
ncbi:MAG: Mov34/MPN/PAD-1 family protein [Deltaproteobacteria bacterium]|nr:Mov34/MPN/PAD-1 family protein [Deltaproteobacteria bacterium]